jgi:hypothetical protein
MDANSPDQRHSLDELSALVGLSKRTIRYYIGLGLVARPLGRPRVRSTQQSTSNNSPR